ncbi:MAG: inosine monophosphate cyclohydrolase [Treponema sp.]|nr:inosine monophosphate cyclohydrolase [Treponema sp.]
MKEIDLKAELASISYPGRGIVIGQSDDGTFAVAAYFIMGRSENSRNRIFIEEGEGIRTKAFDPSKLTDPHLVIYSPVRVFKNNTIVTNGDQTDTIFDGLQAGKSFEEALQSREFEDDAPNFTPRISGIMHIEKNTFDYALSILKSDDGDGSRCNRFTYSYEKPQNGIAHFIHTYMGDGNPLPSYEGEPKKVKISGNIDDFSVSLWESLHSENKVSLFVRYIDIKTGKYESRIINKRQ